MNPKNIELTKELIKKTYVDQASQAIAQFNSLVTQILSQRRLPEKGWDDKTIEWFLAQLAMMDSNNFIENAGVGEREGRLYSDIVSRRHFGFAHGIGRSGDINEQQPKAAGSSLIQKLTTYFVLDAMSIAGIEKVDHCLVLPMATGMSIALSLMTLKNNFCPPTAKYVLWPRIDQKSCLKSIATSGLIPVVIDNVLQGDVITTNLALLEETIVKLGPESIVCVMSTTSCFAPRIPDKIIEISQMCKRFNIGHVINNAYGLQCTKITHQISQSCRLGRVDAIIQSTDKNFMVPVGGAIVASPNEKLIDTLAKNYPGRASGAPILDMFITLLSMGKQGYKALLDERKSLIPYFTHELDKVAKEFGYRLLHTPGNTISFGVTLQKAHSDTDPEPSASSSVSPSQSVSMIGSKLFMRSCSGARVIDLKGGKKTVAGIEFEAYGSHIDHYHSNYLTVACAIGITKDDVDTFIKRLKKVLIQ
ncbi:hypothetical protein SAMD00019534_065720 [Acytostelium subglobosum LB1]|uniref:hypothetical protein n=1 Tax=Acytostelium subglobosum LB1 TaxID=1410327 RepID=UPI0006449275|nr:hypothetical protein SAMD00019534_065720 [Acytostelium subglobosum LB1]GAM23397.1 hypothetical protein SAMD00019534_065720 [Acytostelium subglobosum LB1]|eukprot:XP_012753846.1 hypothetical protein SAMD00019534_065720 [Acytostelium subglobosum LB1]